MLEALLGLTINYELWKVAVVSASLALSNLGLVLFLMRPQMRCETLVSHGETLVLKVKTLLPGYNN